MLVALRKGSHNMRPFIIFAVFLALLTVASVATAQKIGLSFNEANHEYVIDGRTMLVPNPDFFNFDSAVVWVVAYDIPEIFGYEYNLSSTDATATASTPIVYPSEGADIATPMKKSGIFPPVVGYMVSIGEQSGQLEEMLDQVAKAYDEEIDLTVQKLTSLMEPFLIILLAGGVGFIVISVMLPILKISDIDNIRRK